MALMQTFFDVSVQTTFRLRNSRRISSLDNLQCPGRTVTVETPPTEITDTSSIQLILDVCLNRAISAI